MRILIKNINTLVDAIERDSEECITIKNAFLAIDENQIIGYDTMDNWGGITDWRDLEIIDADGSLVYAFENKQVSKIKEGEFSNIVISKSIDNINEMELPLEANNISRTI